MAVDPITQAYRALRTSLMAWPQLAALFRVANFFPDLTATGFPGLKPQLSAADTPEIVLTQGAFALLPRGRNSLCANVTQTFPIIITVESVKLPKTNVIKFELLRAIASAPENLGIPFVRTSYVNGGNDEQFGSIEGTRRKPYRITAANVVVEMDIPRNTLLHL